MIFKNLEIEVKRSIDLRKDSMRVSLKEIGTGCDCIHRVSNSEH